MPIQTKKTIVNSSEISSEINLNLPATMSAADKRRAKDEVGEFLIDSILQNVGTAKSPVKGEVFPVLSKDYKKEKAGEGRGTKANLELSGDMLDSLVFKHTEKGVKVGIIGGEAAKADGHNNFSGKSQIPQRRFLPEEGQSFKSGIESEVNSIIREHTAISTKVKRSDLSGISSRSQLNDFLRSTFTELSIRQAKNAILINEGLREIFDSVLRFF